MSGVIVDAKDKIPQNALERKSYTSIGVCIFLYALSASLAIPAFPVITLRICDHDSSLSAYYYGIGMFIRNAVETVISPILGTIADVQGRKVVLFSSFLSNAFEFIAMAFFPSLDTLFICRAISGMGDAGLATAYAIISDIATYNGDNLTVKFGELGGTWMGGARYLSPYLSF